MSIICDFSFNIKGWRVVTDKVISPEDWQKSEQYWQAEAKNWDDFAPKLAFLPPLKRRRLSESARLFFEASWDLVENEPNIPTILASSNGEINRNFALWQSLLQEGDVSPTSFSLSVHNAIVGQWSELRQVKTETTAIMAQKDNLEVAIVEAFLQLNDGHEQVLVVITELPLDENYNAQPVIRQPFGYALALVLEKGEQYQLTLSDQAVENSEFFAKDNALAFVKNQYLNQTKWQTLSSRGGVWLWQQN